MNKSLEVIVLPVGSMNANCYLVIDTKSYETMIIDPGDGADFIIRKIQDLNVTPNFIVATHGHFDHIMGVTELKLAYDIPFFVHAADEFLVKNMSVSVKHFLGIHSDPPPLIDSNFQDKKQIQLGNNSFEILHTPGHTPGSICLYNKRNNFLFVGDLIFAHGGVGRTDFSYSEPAKLTKSIKKVLKIAENVIVFPGHGETTMIETERKFHFS